MATVVMVEEATGPDTSPAASINNVPRSSFGFLARWRKKFSITTIASSITMPVAIAMALSVMMFKDIPSHFMNTSALKSEVGIEVTT